MKKKVYRVTLKVDLDPLAPDTQRLLQTLTMAGYKAAIVHATIKSVDADE